MKKSIVIRPLPFIFNLALSLGGGALIGLISRPTSEYDALIKPPLSPPPFVFGIVWTILYTLMAVSITLAISKSNNTETASKLYYAQLLVNFMWSILFFNLGLLTFSFVWILLLICLVVFMIVSFYRISPLAAVLQIPYLIWLLFASYLNLGFAILN